MRICVGCWMNWRLRTSTRQHSQRHHVEGNQVIHAQRRADPLRHQSTITGCALARPRYPRRLKSLRAFACSPPKTTDPLNARQAIKSGCERSPELGRHDISIVRSRLHFGHRLRSGLQPRHSERFGGVARQSSGLMLPRTALRATLKHCSRMLHGTNGRMRFGQKSQANRRFLKVGARGSRCSASRVRI
jgi:hypothetical protein